MIRDLALAASGLLTPRDRRPERSPAAAGGVCHADLRRQRKWVESTGADRYRRGMYTFFQRTSPYPMLMTFDSPDSNECAARRQTSNTPLQALTLWNDPAFVEAAQSLGRRIVAEVPGEGDRQQTARLRAERAFLLCLARQPSAAELVDVLHLYEVSRELASRDGNAGPADRRRSAADFVGRSGRAGRLGQRGAGAAESG